MSSGRGRSWRPVNQRSGRDRRKRTVILLITVLVCLIAAALVPILLPKEPAVQFVSLCVPEQDYQSAGLPVSFGSSSSVSQQRLKQPLLALHKLNPSRVKPPVFTDNIEGLDHVAASGQKLVLYCGLEPFVDIDKGSKKTVLKLREAGGASSTFVELLQVLKEVRASEILLLVDPVIRSPGLVHGDDRVDVVELIQKAVQDNRVRNLVVICACDRQQLSWPYITDQLLHPTTPEDGSGQAPQSPGRFGTFQGTAFSHFFREAIMKSACGSGDELFQFLADNIPTWVEGTYGQPQTVLMFPEQSTTAKRELLARIQWPTEADFEPDTKERSKDSENSATESQSDSTANLDAKTEVPDTPDKLAADLQQRWNSLRSLEQVSSAAPAEWMELNAIVLAAESALRQGDERTFNSMYSKAGRTIDLIEDRLQAIAAFRSGARLAPWFTTASATHEETSDAPFADTLAEAFDEQSPRLFPRELTRSRIARQQFSDWFLDDLQNLAEVIGTKPVEEGTQLIAVRAVFLHRLSGLGWPKEDWPEHFFTMETVLSQGDHQWHISALKPLMKLIRLRRDALQIATGQIKGSKTAARTGSGEDRQNQLLRRVVWKNGTDKINSVLAELLASERWLAVGPAGVRMATKSLDAAETSLNDAKRDFQLQQQLVSTQDQQRTDLPLQIQFLAQQMEQVPLSENELLSAEKMAAAILNGNSGVQQVFPAALLKPAGIGSREIEAMFKLTRSYQQEAVKAEDANNQRILDAYFDSRITKANSSLSLQNLLQIPQLADRHNAIISGFSSSQTELIDPRQNSGIWLGFWSARLLEAFSGTDQTEIWNQWKALIAAARGKEPEEHRIAKHRLMQSLQAGWNQSYANLTDQPPSALYVTDDDAAKLIGEALLQRAKVDPINRVYFHRHAKRIAQLSATAPDSPLTCPELTALDDNNQAVLKVDTKGAKYLFVSRTELELQSPQAELEEDWYRVEAQSTSQLVFHSSGGITAPETVVIAAVDEAGHVLSHRAITIAPNGRTSWQVVFLGTDGTEQVLRERDLELSPSTRDAKDPTKDLPTPLRVRIVQRDGVAKQIAVQCFAADNKPFWPAPHQLTLDENNSVFLPLSPPTGKPNPAASSDTASIDVTDGLRFEITPVNVIGAETTSIPVFPKLALPDKFAIRPEPVYDPIRQELSFQIEKVTNSGIARRQKIPVQVEFSPALKILLEDTGTPTSIPNLPERAQSFHYKFKSGLRQSFNLAPQHPERSELEFSISIAGIPQAWRWQLTENGIHSLSDDQLSVRTQLQIANPTEAVPVANQSKIIIGDNWNLAKLNASVFLHGGDFSSKQHPWKLDLRVENTVSRQQVSVLADPISPHSRWKQSVTIGPGEKGAWHFSTHSQPYGIQGLQLRSFGLQAGRFDLIAVLSQTDNPNQTVEHRTPFVFDGTPPVVAINDIKTPPNISVASDLKGTIAATDPESGVIGIRVGMSEAKLRPVNIDFGASTGGEFTIRVAEKSFPQITRTNQAEYADADLIAEITNGAGLKTVIRKTLTFSAAALPMKVVDEGPAKPGKVTFAWPTKTKYTVTLTGPDGASQKASGVGIVEFADVPPGKYHIKWDAGFGPRDHSGSVTVESGKTTPVEK